MSQHNNPRSSDSTTSSSSGSNGSSSDTDDQLKTSQGLDSNGSNSSFDQVKGPHERSDSGSESNGFTTLRVDPSTSDNKQTLSHEGAQDPNMAKEQPKKDNETEEKVKVVDEQDKVQNPVTGGNIEGNQSVTTGEKSPLTNSDRESETPISSKGSSFSVIGSDPSTSGDEEDKDDDHALVLQQPQENISAEEEAVKTSKVDGEVEVSSTGGDYKNEGKEDVQSDTEEKVVKMGQVGEKVQGLNTEKDQIQLSNNRDEGDNKSNSSLNSGPLEEENITVIELSDTTTASSPRFTPGDCSTPANNQQTDKPDDNNSEIDLSSSDDGNSFDERSLIDDDQSQTSEQLKDNGNTDSENTKRSAASIVAISTLAIAATALVAASIYFEVMLTAGAIAGACCLAAAVITYCYTQPSTSLENTKVNEQDNFKEDNIASR